MRAEIYFRKYIFQNIFEKVYFPKIYFRKNNSRNYKWEKNMWGYILLKIFYLPQ